MKLGKAFRKARIRSGLRQNELAARLDVSPTYISMLENDRRDPSWSFICRCCDTLGIAVPLLLLLASDDGEQGPPSKSNTRVQQNLSEVLLELSKAVASSDETRTS